MSLALKPITTPSPSNPTNPLPLLSKGSDDMPREPLASTGLDIGTGPNATYGTYSGRTQEDEEEGEAQPLDRIISPAVAAEVVEARPKKMSRTGIYALIAVCLMSVGSHFGMYLLGPLKSRLHRDMGTSNSQFSLLIASFNLNSTWTPLVAGMLVTRFGTSWSSVATTTCVLLGQLILMLGVSTSHLVLMTLGMFIFGLGTTPLAVVQESLVSHLSPSNHLGMSLALGLLSGKSASFVSSLISLPLAEKVGDIVPFALAVALCAVSFVGNWMRLALRWGREDGREAQVKEKRKVSWGGIGSLGDVFWVYILLNILSGAIWSPFLHNAANLIQIRYSLSETVASTQASILLSGAIFLYPVAGYLTDRFHPSNPQTTFLLIILCSILTFLAYTCLLIPPSISSTPFLGMVLFSTGHGMSTLLLVILEPKLLPAHLIPLGLGLHKSLETASSSLSQTLAGIILDHIRDKADPDTADFQAGQGLLTIFWVINALQLACAIYLWRLEKSRRSRLRTEIERAEEYERIPIADDELDDDEDDHEYAEGGIREEAVKPKTEEVIEVKSAMAATAVERKRGRWFFFASVGFIGLVWIAFLSTAVRKL